MKTFSFNYFYLGLLIFNYQITFSQAMYNINDPRNPECPCHNYQKIADDEYKKLLATAIKNQNYGKGNLSKTVSGTESHTININKSTIFKKYKMRNKRKKIKRFDIIKMKHWTFWKRLSKPDACSTW